MGLVLSVRFLADGRVVCQPHYAKIISRDHQIPIRIGRGDVQVGAVPAIQEQALDVPAGDQWVVDEIELIGVRDVRAVYYSILLSIQRPVDDLVVPVERAQEQAVGGELQRSWRRCAGGASSTGSVPPSRTLSWSAR